MTNPTPRPALRKAADADVHPAAPRPARSPRARSPAVTVAPVPEPSPVPVLEDVSVDAVTVDATSPAETVPAPLKPAKKRHADPGHGTKPTKRKFSGSTSDHLRVPEVDTPVARTESSSTRPRRTKPITRETDALMSGKTTELEVTVPKKLRKAAKAEAKRRGLDLDAVVSELLHDWLTRG